MADFQQFYVLFQLSLEQMHCFEAAHCVHISMYINIHMYVIVREGRQQEAEVETKIKTTRVSVTEMKYKINVGKLLNEQLRMQPLKCLR